MRKLLLIWAVLCLASCSSDDFNDDPNSNNEVIAELKDGLLYANGMYFEIQSETEKTATVRKTEPSYFYSHPNCEIPAYIKYEETKYTVISIGESAFDSVDNVYSVSFPNTLTSIEYGAFWSCNHITSFKFPNSINTIGPKAFYACKGLTSLDIPNSVKQIGRSMCEDCYNLTTVRIGDGVENIPYHAFSGCDIKNLTLGNSITIIGKYAFESNYNLKSIVFPANVISIQDGAIRYCSLEEMHFLSKTPPSVNWEENSITDVDGKDEYKDATIYVPKQSLELYKSTYGVYFTNIIGE